MVKMPSLDDLAQGDKVGYPKMEVSIHLGSEAQHRPPRAPGIQVVHIYTPGQHSYIRLFKFFVFFMTWTGARVMDMTKVFVVQT